MITTTNLRQASKVSVFIFFALVGASMAIAQTQSPPNGNTNPPLNDSATGQVKTGGLSLGSLIVNGGALFNGIVTVNTNGGRIVLGTGTNSSGYPLNIGVNNDGVNFDIGSASRGFNFSNNNGRLATITSAGNVAIGKNPESARLDVNGRTDIHAQADSVGWGINLYSLDDSLRTQMHLTNVGDFRIRNGGSDFTITSDGNYGFGVAPSVGLKVDVGGKVGATEYCDADGANCTTAVEIATAAAGGDDLGNHIATQTLNMGGNSITNASVIRGTPTTGAGTPTFSFEGDSNTGIFNVSNGTVGISTNGATAAKFSPSGIETNRYGVSGIYSSSQVQGIWTLGDQYRVDLGANDFGAQYGMTYSYNTTGGGISGWGHQIHFTNAGSRNATISVTNGRGAFSSICDQNGGNCTTPAEIASGSAGDNLGNHLATTILNMNGNDINNVGSLIANGQAALNAGLYVDGNIMIDAGGYSHTAQATADNHYGYFEARNDSGSRGAYFGYGDGDSRVDLIVDAASTLYIGSGSVGIGDPTPDGGLALDVSGNIGASAYCNTEGTSCTTAAEIASASGGINNSYLRSDVTDYFTGPLLSVERSTTNEIESSAGGLGQLEIRNSNTSGDAFMTFHIANDFATYFGLDGETNELVVGGWSKGAAKYEIWHAGNDGAGSGLDADTVDGLTSTQLKDDLGNHTATTNLNMNSNQILNVSRLHMNNSGTYDIWIEGEGNAGGSNRNLGLLGLKSSDTLFLNYNGEYTGGVHVGSNGTGVDLEANGTGVFAGTVSASTPTAAGHLTTKAYVDSAVAGAGGSGDDLGNGGTTAGTLYTSTGSVGTNSNNRTNFGNGGSARLDYVNGTNVTTLGPTALYPGANNTIQLGLSNRRWNVVYGNIGNFTSNVTAATPTAAGHLTTKAYVDSAVGSASDNLGNHTATQTLNMNNKPIQGVSSVQFQANNGYIYPSGNGLAIRASTSYFTFDSTGFHVLGNKQASAGSFVYSSDRRLKHNFADLKNAQDILSLGTYTFDWNKDTEGAKGKNATNDIGIIAQEVEKVFPQFVYTDEEGYKSVDYVKLVVPLLEVTKEQERKIDSLEARLQVLENK